VTQKFYSSIILQLLPGARAEKVQPLPALKDALRELLTKQDSALTKNHKNKKNIITHLGSRQLIFCTTAQKIFFIVTQLNCLIYNLKECT